MIAGTQKQPQLPSLATHCAINRPRHCLVSEPALAPGARVIAVYLPLLEWSRNAQPDIVWSYGSILEMYRRPVRCACRAGGHMSSLASVCSTKHVMPASLQPHSSRATHGPRCAQGVGRNFSDGNLNAEQERIWKYNLPNSRPPQPLDFCLP